MPDDKVIRYSTHRPTAGILVIRGEVSPGYPDILSTDDGMWVMHVHKPDWHDSIEQASKDLAEKLRSRLASLKRQVEETKMAIEEIEAGRPPIALHSSARGHYDLPAYATHTKPKTSKERK